MWAQNRVNEVLYSKQCYLDLCPSWMIKSSVGDLGMLRVENVSALEEATQETKASC